VPWAFSAGRQISSQSTLLAFFCSSALCRLSQYCCTNDTVFSTPFESPVASLIYNDGNWITDPTQAFSFKQMQEYEIATSRSARFKEPGSLYKGAAANLRHLDEHARNIVMGHKKGGTFAYYVQVRDDTQSTFMETPARDALLKLCKSDPRCICTTRPEHFAKARAWEGPRTYWPEAQVHSSLWGSQELFSLAAHVRDLVHI